MPDPQDHLLSTPDPGISGCLYVRPNTHCSTMRAQILVILHSVAILGMKSQKQIGSNYICIIFTVLQAAVQRADQKPLTVKTEIFCSLPLPSQHLQSKLLEQTFE